MSPSWNCGTVVVGMYLAWSAMPYDRSMKHLAVLRDEHRRAAGRRLEYGLNSESTNAIVTGDSLAARCMTVRVARL